MSTLRILLCNLAAMSVYASAYATPPCAPSESYRGSAKKVFVASIESLDIDRDGALTCWSNGGASSDAGCLLTTYLLANTHITRWEKGKQNEASTLAIEKSWCAPDLPEHSGGTYRFYADTRIADGKTRYFYYDYEKVNP